MFKKTCIKVPVEKTQFRSFKGPLSYHTVLIFSSYAFFLLLSQFSCSSTGHNLCLTSSHSSIHSVWNSFANIFVFLYHDKQQGQNKEKKKYLISAVNLHSDRSLSSFYRFTGIKTHLGVWGTREKSIIIQINHYNLFFSFTACLVFTSIQAAPQFWKQFPARSKAALKSPDQRTGTSYEHAYHNFRLK